jgi:hypothetical protein
MTPGRLKILNESTAMVIGGELEFDGFTLRAGDCLGLWTLMQQGLVTKHKKNMRDTMRYVNGKASRNKVVLSMCQTQGLKS